MCKQLNETTYHLLKLPDPSIEVTALPLLVCIRKLSFRVESCISHIFNCHHIKNAAYSTRTQADEIDVCIVDFPVPLVQILEPSIDSI